MTFPVRSTTNDGNVPPPPVQALEYLFKFIVQSRILYSRATCGMEEDQFRASIQELFQSIRFVLSLDSRSSENLVFTQVRSDSPPPRENAPRLIFGLLLSLFSYFQLRLLCYLFFSNFSSCASCD